MARFHDKSVRFIPPAAKGTNEWRGMPPAETITCDGHTCTIELPASRDRGHLKVEREDCPAWALIAVDGGKRDLQSFMMDCGQIRMHTGSIE